MTPTQSLEEWMEKVWNQRDTRYIHDHLGEACTIEGLPESSQTPEGFAEFRDGLVAAIPDMHITVVEAVENGENVAGICQVTGTHGTTKARVDFRFGFTACIRDGKIIHARNVVDFLTMLEQTELVPQEALQRCLAPS